MTFVKWKCSIFYNFKVKADMFSLELNWTISWLIELLKRKLISSYFMVSFIQEGENLRGF